MRSNEFKGNKRKGAAQVSCLLLVDEGGGLWKNAWKSGERILFPLFFFERAEFHRLEICVIFG